MNQVGTSCTIKQIFNSRHFMNLILRVLVSLILVLAVFIATANPFAKRVTIDAKMIDAHLSKQFPIEKVYQGVIATFYDPKIDINALDKKVKIRISVRAQQQEQSLLAKAKLVGNIEYHEFSQTIRLSEPALDDFTLVSGSSEDSQNMVKKIRQSMGNSFQHITLVDLDSMSVLNASKEPTDIQVSLNKLILYW